MPMIRTARLAVFTLLLASCAAESGDSAADDAAVGAASDTAAVSGTPTASGAVIASPTASVAGDPAASSTGSDASAGGSGSAVVGPDASGVTSGGNSSEPMNDGSATPGSSSGPPTVPTATDSQSPPSGAGGSNEPPNGTGGEGSAAGATGLGGAGGGTGGTPGVGGMGGGDSEPIDTNPGATTLRDKYDGYFAIGAAVDAQSYTTHAEILTTHFNSVTSENDMKFESLQPTQGNFTWGAADQMVDWAANNGMMVRGHALVWHRQTPSWVFAGSNGGQATREQLLDRMQAHISAVMDHFRGKVQVWDVVNEAILNDGSFRTGEAPETIDQSGWYRIMGEDYIAAAFRYAREADPDVKLFYNDYYNYLPAKREGILAMLQRLIDEGVPIDGVGLQCHINIEPSTVETHQSYHQTVENMEEAIKAYSALGLDVQITEMDLSLYIGGRMYQQSEFYTLQTFTEELQQKQAERYREFFELFRKYRDAISSVSFWGVADDNTWLSEFDSGRTDFPLLFDVNHDPKPAFDAVMDF